jgi:hypothetical protein
MEQRRLRLGDILDDYCPRERRVTNHAVVAMVEEDVKQTRCTTCDAEHVYKGGKEPRRRKKDTGSALYKEVLAGMPESVDLPVPAVPIAAVPVPAAIAAPLPVPAIEASPALDEPADVRPDDGDEEPDAPPAADEGPFHRRLIRATLPRPEGQKDVRQAPDFTIRQNGGRGPQGFRGGQKMRGHGGNGARGPGGPGRGPARRFGGGGAPGMPGGRGPGGNAGPGRGGRPGFGGNRGRKR